MGLGKNQEALRSFQEILRFSPQSADAANAMAVVYFKQGKYDAGRQTFTKAGQINTTNERVKANQKQLQAYDKK